MSDLTALNIDVEEESKGVRDFTALPAGDYQVVVTQSEMKENKNTQGSHLGATLEVIEGDFKGRLFFANFNVQNANPTAEKIGRAELASLCKAVGVTNPEDSQQLHDIPLLVTVGIDRKEPTRNVIKKYAALDGAATEAAPAPAPKATPPPAAKPAPGARKPWQKK